MKYVEVKAAKEYANTVMADPILKAAVNSILDNAPGADIAPVVRCKDCKHFQPTGYPLDRMGCLKFLGLTIPKKDGSDFCSYGERKDNGK